MSRVQRSFRAAALHAIVAAVLVAPAFARADLPSVSSGQAPGPPLLYGPEPDAPQLDVSAPFSADPLLVSGTDAYRDGEYVYQDYLFDDRGADTVPGPGNRPGAADQNFSPTAGDVQYPTAAKYAGNVADLVELRIKPTADAIVYRVTLNSLVQADTTVVGIGIDTNLGGGAQVEWPNGAGVSSPGLDQFITAWGTDGEVTSLPGGATTDLADGAVSVDTTTKQMTITVPRAVLDPGTATWRYVAGTGLWDSAAGEWKTPSQSASATAEQPATGNPVVPAPAVFNLAFRFDEPQVKQPGATPPIPYTTAPGTGNWFEDKQAHVLSAVGQTTTGAGLAGGSDFHADVDFSKLAAQADEDIHGPGATQARIMPSGLDVPQGVRVGFPQYGGELQPYVLRVPAGTDPSDPTGLTFALHSLGGTYTQFAVFSPNQLVQLGDERGNLVATPLGHGPDGWYTDEGEADVFEVWADIDRHFELDPERSYVSGYSMGGYGSYKLGVEYPDLWAKAFTVVGPPGEGIWIPPGDPTSGPETLTADLLANVRWVPFMNWIGTNDELVPVAGPLAQQQRFDDLGLRSETFAFTGSDHFALAIADAWDAGRDFLGDSTVERDPSRVDYAFFPAADRPALGLVHDHAYWVSELEARAAAAAGDLASFSGRSLASGEGDPATAPVSGGGADAGPPIPYVKTGTEWTGIPATKAENALEVELANVASAVVDGRRADLDGSRELRVEIDTDGPTELDLDLALPAGATAVRTDGGAEQPAPEVALDAGGATFEVDSASQRTYVIRPPAAGGGGPSDPGPGPGPGAGDAAAPDTTITAAPKRRVKKRRASFAFSSSQPGSTFECSLDGGAFAPCASPAAVKAGRGRHTFAVRAVNAAGNADPTPATVRWKVRKKRK